MKLYVKRIGDGFPVIILHGLYGSGDNWLTIAKNLAAICEVFLVDQRNHGRSPHSDQHDYPALAEDLLEMMNEYKLDKAVLIGHSMGGKAAMWFAALYPSRVSRLIIADISPRSYLDPAGNFSHNAFHVNVMDSMLAVDFSHADGIGDVDRQLEDRLPDKLLRQFLLKNIGKDSHSDLFWRLNLKVLRENLNNLSSGLEPFLERGEKFKQFPVVFIKGEQSRYIGAEDLEMIHQLYPDAQVLTVKNSGHWLHAEQPASVLAIIRRSLLS
ncbi:MAG: alpha/beta fold hydrolase [Bacteroidales bacterium]|jgi:pimeloyl-ACP methyl ester carboxylesterase